MVDENVYVVIDTSPEMMGQMVEISSTGMAFTFVDLDAVSNRLSGRSDLRMDLFAAGKGYFIRDLPAKLISTIETGGDKPSTGTSVEACCRPKETLLKKASRGSLSPIMIKRIGVEFGSLSLSQQVQINSLIRRQSEVTASNMPL